MPVHLGSESQISMESALSSKSKRSIMMLTDAILLPVALWVSVVLRYGDFQKDVFPFWWLFAIASISGVFALQKLGLYRAVVRYIGPSSMVPVVQGVTVAAVVVSLSAYLSQTVSFPRSSPIIFWFVSILLIGGVRVVVRTYFYGLIGGYRSREPIAIYGAGETGAQLAIALLNGAEYIPVAFIDDNRSLRKSVIHGIRVYDSLHIDRLVEDFGIRQVFLSVPSATSEQRSRILNRLAVLPILVKTVPNFGDLISGSAQLNNVSDVEIGDLLGRDMVPPQEELISASVASKSVLVTGAGGTIGSEICRKIVSLKPKILVLYDNSEFALYVAEKELRLLGYEVELVFLLGSVMNKSHFDNIIKNFKIETIYHAAAFKHVPMVESNIIEGVRNNVVGTWNVVDSAARNNVKELVLISSDKAVRPTNVMGATKRLAELIVHAYADQFPDLKYSMVRFGNVLRSSGSVVPLFEDQIRKGGPVTVTHKDATRFFMTASEAAELVIQAGAMASGGELYVLDMGEPVKIDDLATKMIHLHGYQVKGSADDLSSLERQKIEVEYIGLRAGEKLYEELIIGESVSGTLHPKIMMAKEERLPFDALILVCEQLHSACDKADYLTVRKILEDNVAGFTLHSVNTDPMLKMTLEKPMATITPFVKK